MTAALKTLAQDLVSSSGFTSSDKMSFSVPVEEGVHLPGSHDPDAYLDTLGLDDLTGMRVAVLCPDNGGLVAAVLHRGAKSVLACEPRYFYHKSLPRVLSMIPKETGVQVSYLNDWPRGDEEVDLVLWPDGLQDTKTPRRVLKRVFSMLAPGGACYVEIILGSHGPAPDSSNAWKPSEEALRTTLEQESPDAELEKVGVGRMENRAVFRISEPEPVVVIEDESEPKPKPKKSAKKPAKRKKTRRTKTSSEASRKRRSEAAKKAWAKRKAAKAPRKKPQPRGTDDRIAEVAKLTGSTVEEVQAEVDLWGLAWLDQQIATHEDKSSKSTTSDNIGVSPIEPEAG